MVDFERRKISIAKPGEYSDEFLWRHMDKLVSKSNNVHSYNIDLNISDKKAVPAKMIIDAFYWNARDYQSKYYNAKEYNRKLNTLIEGIKSELHATKKQRDAFFQDLSFGLRENIKLYKELHWSKVENMIWRFIALCVFGWFAGVAIATITGAA